MAYSFSKVLTVDGTTTTGIFSAPDDARTSSFGKVSFYIPSGLTINVTVSLDGTNFVAPSDGSSLAGEQIYAYTAATTVAVKVTRVSGSGSVVITSDAAAGGGAAGGGGGGDASAANQTNGSQKTQIVDGSGNVISSTSNALDVNIKSGVAISVNLSQANDDVLVYGFDGAANQKIATDTAGITRVNLIAGETQITGGAGVVAANSPRVTLASDDPAVTSLAILDDWDESDRAKVNLIAGQAGVTGGAGVVAANTQRTTLASDDPAVTSLAILDDWDESDRAKVNLIAGQAGVTGGAGAVAANTQRTTLASDDPAVTALQTIDDWDESDRAKVNLIVGQAGIQGGSGAVSATTVRVSPATDVNAPINIAQVGGSTHSVTNPVFNASVATTTGGTSIYRSLDLDETEEEVKGTAGQVYGFYVYNNATSVRYIKLYNDTAANVTVGTTTPVLTFGVPAQTSGGSGAVVMLPTPVAFGTAITAAATTGVADSDTGAPGANDCVVNFFYK